MIFKRKSDGVMVVGVADTHTNSTVGVNPLHVDLGEDGDWRAGEAGQWLWRCWIDFWDRVYAIKKEHGVKLYVVADGDLMDDPYHPTTKVVTQQKDVIVKSGVRIYARPREMADEFFVVGGTAAHAGVDFWIEELFAQALGSTPDEERNKHAWAHLRLMASEVLFDVCHHPEVVAYRPWTEHSAPVRQAEIIRNRYVDMDERVPDEAIRAHAHYFSPTGNAHKPRVVYLPPWQLTRTTFGHRRGGAYFARPVGGVWYLCKDGRALFDFKTYRGKVRDVWTA